MGTIIGRYILPHPPVLIPEIGKAKAKEAPDTTDALAAIGREIAELQPDTIIITSPHAQFFRDYFFISDQPRISGDLSQFGKKNILLGFNNDVSLAQAIAANATAKGIPAGSMDHKELRRRNMDYDLDHGIMVPMYFICHFYRGFRLVPVALSGRSNVDHYRLGMAMREEIEKSDRRVVIIASGDLSHKLKEDGPYGFAPEGPKFDTLIEKSFRQGNVIGLLDMDCNLAEKAAQCGLYSFDILLGTLEGHAMEAEILSHEGPFGVGYMTAKII
ncbi:MAG: AmmeMemoRadiSam system protein B, partial [Bacillota bacterium]|nr:AmmeMemoRadiSam system protein B [Bacillota bacterium]